MLGFGGSLAMKCISLNNKERIDQGLLIWILLSFIRASLV